MLRHIVGYTNFSSEDLFQAGFSKLLTYSDFNDAAALPPGSLYLKVNRCCASLFQVSESREMRCWIGEDLAPFFTGGHRLLCHRHPLSDQPNTLWSARHPRTHRLPYREQFGQSKRSLTAFPILSQEAFINLNSLSAAETLPCELSKTTPDSSTRATAASRGQIS